MAEWLGWRQAYILSRDQCESIGNRQFLSHSSSSFLLDLKQKRKKQKRKKQKEFSKTDLFIDGEYDNILSM